MLLKRAFFLSVLVGVTAGLAGLCRAAVTLEIADGESTLIVAGAGSRILTIGVTGATAGGRLQVELSRADHGAGEPAEAAVRGSANVPPAAGRQVIQVAVPIPALGLFRMRVSATTAAGEKVAEVETTFAAVPPQREHAVADFGVCTHYGGLRDAAVRNRSVELIRLAGFGRVRDECSWSSVERAAGRFVFPAVADEYFASVAKAGMQPLLLLDYSNPKVYPELFKGSSGAFPRSPGAREAFARYAHACVGHFGDRVKTWEVWNEPHSWGHATPAEYAELLKVVYPAIKQARPDAYVISCGGGGAGGGPGGDYISGVIRAGGVDFQDGFSVHPYMTPNSPELGYPAKNAPLGPRVNVPAVWSHLDRLTNNLKNHRTDGKRLDWWVTEIGWTYTADSDDAEMYQAAALARTFLLARRFGTARGTFWYDFIEDGSDAANKEHHFGLIRKDFSPKPAYVAAANVLWALGDRAWKRALVDDEHVKAMQYGEGADAVYAVWAVTSESEVSATASTTLMLAPGKYIVRDWQGRAGPPVVVGSAGLTLMARSLPVYVSPAGPAVDARTSE